MSLLESIKNVGSRVLHMRVKPNPNRDDPNKNSIIDFVESEGTTITDMSDLSKFRTMSSERELQYKYYDEMEQDSVIATALQMYADDATQSNSRGQIIWAESDDNDVSAFANRLIDVLDLNSKAWSHIYSLVKYGDLYLETFRDDEDEDNIEGSYRSIDGIGTAKVSHNKIGSQLEEYVEAVANPAEIFDLVKKGKTVGFIKVPSGDIDGYSTSTQNYRMTQQGDETILLRADKYVHMALSQGSNRFPETLSFTYLDEDGEDSLTKTYRVNRGRSILHDIYKAYRELSLMEDSILLNRVTRSSIVRILQVEVGDMPKSQARETLKKIKRIIEQKNYMDKNDGSYSSQATPGPVDNVIYNPTKDGKGSISVSSLGGDIDVKSIVDLEYYRGKLAGGLKVPQAYLVGQCLRHTVELTLLNGQKRSIGYLYENRDKYIGKGIMSCNSDGTLVPTIITNIMKTRLNASYVRVTLDNGKYLDVTPDHRFMLRDGTFIEAQYLGHGDSLMPYYDSVRKGRRFVLDNKTNLWKPQYRLVAEHKYGNLPPNHQVHHVNKIKIDDDFDNLKLMTIAEHASIHGRHSIKKTHKQRELDKVNMTEFEYKEKYGRGGRAIKGYKRTSETKAKISNSLKNYTMTKEHRDNISKSWLSDPNNYNVSLANLEKANKRNRELYEERLKTDPGYVNIRCFRCGEIHRRYLEEIIRDKYLNKELFLYCDSNCANLYPHSTKLGPSIKLYYDVSGDNRLYEEQRELLGPCKYLTITTFNKEVANKLLVGYNPVVQNHKVVSVETLDVIEDAYDITVENESHTFATSAGVFIHNSDDGGGLSSGTALTKLDSRYARTVKRNQSTYIAGVELLINLFAIDKGLLDHVNNFTVKMVSPATMEETDRLEMQQINLEYIDSFIEILGEETVSAGTMKEILLYFINNSLNEPEIAELIAEDKIVEETGEEDIGEGNISSPNFSDNRDYSSDSLDNDIDLSPRDDSDTDTGDLDNDIDYDSFTDEF